MDRIDERYQYNTTMSILWQLKDSVILWIYLSLQLRANARINPLLMYILHIDSLPPWMIADSQYIMNNTIYAEIIVGMVCISPNDIPQERLQYYNDIKTSLKMGLLYYTSLVNCTLITTYGLNTRKFWHLRG